MGYGMTFGIFSDIYIYIHHGDVSGFKSENGGAPPSYDHFGNRESIVKENHWIRGILAYPTSDTPKWKLNFEGLRFFATHWQVVLWTTPKSRPGASLCRESENFSGWISLIGVVDSGFQTGMSYAPRESGVGPWLPLPASGMSWIPMTDTQEIASKKKVIPQFLTHTSCICQGREALGGLLPLHPVACGTHGGTGHCPMLRPWPYAEGGILRSSRHQGVQALLGDPQAGVKAWKGFERGGDCDIPWYATFKSSVLFNGLYTVFQGISWPSQHFDTNQFKSHLWLIFYDFLFISNRFLIYSRWRVLSLANLCILTWHVAKFMSWNERT